MNKLKILAFTVLLPLSLSAQSDLIKEHVFGGLPSSTSLTERKAYVFDYDSKHKAPRWVAYHLLPDYRRTPKRTGQWQTYRNDPEFSEEPTNSDYKGVFNDSTRKHMQRSGSILYRFDILNQ